MATLEALGPADLHAVVASYRDALQAHSAAINRLNVYPVPDGDTGTNMALTLQSVVDELDGADSDMATVCKAISHGSLMGARGNLVILAQVMRGLASVLAESDSGDGQRWASALVAASAAAYEAVGNPVEGTILTVVRGGPRRPRRPTAGRPGGRPGRRPREPRPRWIAHPSSFRSSPRTAWSTPAVWASSCCSTPCSTSRTAVRSRSPLRERGSSRPRPLPRRASSRPPSTSTTATCPTCGTRCTLDAPDQSISAFRDVWAGIGDSIVVVGGDGLWNCHIHTDDIGAAVEAALDCGRPRQIRVTDLAEQVQEERWVREAAAEPVEEPERVRVPTAVVAVGVGDGIKRIFHSLGVQSMVAGARA